MPLDTLLLIDEIWVDQVNFESIITTMNLIFSTFFKIMLFIVTDLFMFMLLFLLLKIIYCVSFTLRDNLFESSHNFT